MVRLAPSVTPVIFTSRFYAFHGAGVPRKVSYKRDGNTVSYVKKLHNLRKSESSPVVQYFRQVKGDAWQHDDPTTLWMIVAIMLR